MEKTDRIKKYTSNNMLDESKKSKIMTAVKKTLIYVVIFVVAAAVGYNAKKNQLPPDPNVVAQQETAMLVAKVGALIVLPEGETPTVATVNDPEKLKEQPFFAKAKQGDKVLIYTTSKKAILYDPVANKIVEVAPLNIGTPGTEVTPTPTEPTTNE